MVEPPVPSPEELRRQQQLADQLAEHRYNALRKNRVWTAAGIGFLLSLLLNGGFAIFGNRWGMIILFIITGTIWSIVVQFKTINHLISAAVFGIFGMTILLVSYDPFPPLFWCLAVILNGAFIGIVNDLYRSKYLGI